MPIPEDPSKQRKMPEFIILEEHHDTDEGKFAEEISQIKEIHLPYRVRFLFFVFGLLSIFWALGALACFAISSVVAAFGLYRNVALNQSMKTYWSMFKRAVIFMMAFFLAVINPPLGLGLVMLYFLVSGSGKNDLVNRFIQKNLRDFFHS